MGVRVVVQVGQVAVVRRRMGLMDMTTMTMPSSELRSSEVLPSLAPKSATTMNLQDIPSIEVGVSPASEAGADAISMLENRMKETARQSCPGTMGS